MTSLDTNSCGAVEMYITENWYDLNIEEQFKLLINCKCCERHQVNKPKEISKCDWNTIEQNANDGSDDCNLKCFGGDMCDCDCRHNARFICRDSADLCKEVFAA